MSSKHVGSATTATLAALALGPVTQGALAQSVGVDPRVGDLVDLLPAGGLKDKRASCMGNPLVQTDVSIGHRGPPLMFPEHTIEGNTAAARMGAGILDCDVTFTKGIELADLSAVGVNAIAPPMWVLVTFEDGKIVPAPHSIAAKAAGLNIITWTLARAGPLDAGGGFYFQSIAPLTNHDGVSLGLLDVLAQDVGVRGVFSDWPGTVTFYANCMGL